MKITLKEESNDIWIIVSEKGHVISGPKRFLTQAHAEEWARAFASTWTYCTLYIEGKKK